MSAELEQAIAFMQRVFERDVDAVAAFDVDLRVVYLNSAMELLSGVTHREARGMPLFQVFPGADEGPESSLIRGTLEGRYSTSRGTFFGVAIEQRRPDFESHFAPLSGVGGIIGGVGVARSHNQPVIRGQRLQADERFRTMANSAPVLLWMSGADAMCDFFNQTWLDFTGRSMRQEVGYGWAEGVHPEDFQVCIDTYMEAFKRRRRFDMVYRLRHKSGEYRWILDTGSPRFESDEFMGYIGSCVDITDRKNAEDRLNDTIERLRITNAQMEQFLYAASHDLREPLRMIASYSALLADRYGPSLDDRAKRYTEYMVEGATRMRDLINGLLDFAMVKQRGGESFEMVDCNRILGRVIDNLAALVAESGAEFDVQPLPRVLGHHVLLTQLFQNLLHNSIKFRGDRHPRVGVRAERDRDWRFTVTDNGIGFDVTQAQELFVMFKRYHSRKERAGNGIGLAMCKEIVQIHGGRIWLKSEPGLGTTVTFTLPAIGATDE